MSKHYLPLISLLLVLCFLVAGLAFYRTLTAPQSPQQEATLTILAPTKSPTPVSASPSGQVAATTSSQLVLEILSPTREASTSSSLLPISGKTATEAGVVVNDKQVLVDSEGSFRTSLRLTSGPNLIVITASSAGQSKVWQTVVTYTAPSSTNVPKTN